MSSLELKLPPPVVALAVGLLMSGLAACDFGPLPLSAVWRHVGAAALFGLGLALLLVSGRLFLKARTTWRPHAPEKARKLVISGVYRHSRNPMYAAMLLMLSGWAVFLGQWPSLAGLPLFMLYMTRFQIMPEERALSALFGEEYREYARRVRRWM